MTDTQMWNLIVGVLLPPLIALVQRPTLPTWARSLIAVAASGVAGFVTVWIAGELTGRSVITGVLITLVAAVATYESIWRKVGVTGKVEIATSPRSTAGNAGLVAPDPRVGQVAPNPMPGASTPPPPVQGP
jgi:ABC-type uncharacterized transport system permease subunit